MRIDYEALALVDNAYDQQFEVAAAGFTAFVEYRLDHKMLTLVHTEVPLVLQGKGLGSILVEEVLQHAADQHLTIIPQCPFVASYIHKHPGWYRLVAPGYRPANA